MSQLTCADARHLIHLDSGNDLRAEEEQTLAEHMEHCAECRAYHSGMVSAMSALLALRDEADAHGELSDRSVWPAVSRRIQTVTAQVRRVRPGSDAAGRFNLQIVALSVCSLALAVVTIAQTLSPMRSSMSESEWVPAQSASHSSYADPGKGPWSGGEESRALDAVNPRSLPQSF